MSSQIREAPDSLREVNITVIDRRVCNDPQHYNYKPVIGLNMLCAGSLKGGKDSCNVSTRRPAPSGWGRPQTQRAPSPAVSSREVGCCSVLGLGRCVVRGE